MKFIRQIVAVCMALLILVSTTGFTMSAHFCGGELQSIAFFKQAKSCQMHTKQLPPCHHQNTADAEVEKKRNAVPVGHDQRIVPAENHAQSCCEDQTVIYDGQESLSETVILKVLKPDLQFIAVVTSFLLAVVPTATQHFANSHLYSPPLIERDIPVLVQSFLI